MNTYYSALANYADFSVDDYSSLSSDTHKYTTVQASLNTLISCTGDKWVMYTGGSNCSDYTIWTSSDSETYGNTSANSMCMSVPTFGGLSYTGTNRYTGGCLSSSDLSTANTYIANLYTFYTSANTLYTNQRTSKIIFNNIFST